SSTRRASAISIGSTRRLSVTGSTSTSPTSETTSRSRTRKRTSIHVTWGLSSTTAIASDSRATRGRRRRLGWIRSWDSECHQPGWPDRWGSRLWRQLRGEVSPVGKDTLDLQHAVGAALIQRERRGASLAAQLELSVLQRERALTAEHADRPVDPEVVLAVR